jgi:hypothetical protein
LYYSIDKERAICSAQKGESCDFLITVFLSLIISALALPYEEGQVEDSFGVTNINVQVMAG